MKKFAMILAASAVTAVAANAGAAIVNKTVNSADTWIGYMNVFELPSNGGGFVFGQPWGVPDLDAGWSGANAYVTPNTNIARNVPRSDAFWWTGAGGALPNKTMDANFFVEGAYTAGDTLKFSGIVQSNTLVAPYTSVAFIKELDPNNSYALVNIATVPLTPGAFSIELPITFGLVVQYGFETVGPQSTIGDPTTSQATLGLAVIGPIPEPATAGLLAIAAPALCARRNRRA